MTDFGLGDRIVDEEERERAVRAHGLLVSSSADTQTTAIPVTRPRRPVRKSCRAGKRSTNEAAIVADSSVVTKVKELSP